MAELERAAAELGYARIHLTTGPRQPEAVGLVPGGRIPARASTPPPIRRSIGPLAFAKELMPGAGFVDWVQPTWEQAHARHSVGVTG